MRRALLVAAVAALAACGPFGSDSKDHHRDALDAARGVWARNGPADYDLVVRHSCFCGGPEVAGPVRVRVRGGSIVDRTYEEDGTPVPEGFAAGFPAVDGLFDFVGDAIEREAEFLDVEYDADLGFPVHAFADYVERMADEERGYDVESFEPAS